MHLDLFVMQLLMIGEAKRMLTGLDYRGLQAELQADRAGSIAKEGPMCPECVEYETELVLAASQFADRVARASEKYKQRGSCRGSSSQCHAGQPSPSPGRAADDELEATRRRLAHMAFGAGLAGN